MPEGVQAENASADEMRARHRMADSVDTAMTRATAVQIMRRRHRTATPNAAARPHAITTMDAAEPLVQLLIATSVPMRVAAHDTPAHQRRGDIDGRKSPESPSRIVRRYAEGRLRRPSGVILC